MRVNGCAARMRLRRRRGCARSALACILFISGENPGSRALTSNSQFGSFPKVSVANLNLASQPFRNRALPWTITAVIVIASLIALVLIVRASMLTNAKAAIVETDVNALRIQAKKLQDEASQIRESLTPEQRIMLDAAHTLVDRKRFSWSRLFADLEAVLPANVRVTRIGVHDVAVRGGQTYAELELTVVGKTAEDAIGVVAEMDRTGVFQADPISQNLQRGRGQSGTELTLKVLYTPRAGVARSEGNVAAAGAHGNEAAQGGAR
ncbi:MAG: hypothetical protein AUG51_03600 [Acidobacteria bacterium 13_1_20CM_3_53_8]|nr:MAG: hypothetical protein AUG51_03600 [Acidobacteria bacterium 13_1_20CM_3_53_8]